MRDAIQGTAQLNFTADVDGRGCAAVRRRPVAQLAVPIVSSALERAAREVGACVPS